MAVHPPPPSDDLLEAGGASHTQTRHQEPVTCPSPLLSSLSLPAAVSPVLLFVFLLCLINPSSQPASQPFLSPFTLPVPLPLPTISLSLSPLSPSPYYLPTISLSPSSPSLPSLPENTHTGEYHELHINVLRAVLHRLQLPLPPRPGTSISLAAKRAHIPIRNGAGGLLCYCAHQLGPLVCVRPGNCVEQGGGRTRGEWFRLESWMTFGWCHGFLKWASPT